MLNTICSVIRKMLERNTKDKEVDITGFSTALDQGRYTWHHDSCSRFLSMAYRRTTYHLVMLTSPVTWLALAHQALFHQACHHVLAFSDHINCHDQLLLMILCLQILNLLAY